MVYLSIQVRHSRVLIEANNVATAENSRLLKAEAMERYNENVSRWRGRLIEHEDVAEIWNRALSGQSVDSADAIRLENLWIDWINTYRSNFSHARTVGEEGLERQAVMSVVALMRQASILRELWEWARPFNELASPNFVRSVEANLQNPESEAFVPSPLDKHAERIDD